MGLVKLRKKAEELFGSDYNEFEVEDLFNKGNWLKGYICRRSTDLYGALFITHVNSKEQPQLIFSTPKMHYPFDKVGRYRFPSATEIEIFVKLDGTNIVAYRYHLDSKEFQTYKTRLTPVVRSGRFGDFYSMWFEMLNKYPDIEKVCIKNQCNVSFELYGIRNKHLVWYDVPLDCAVLFGVTSNGQIISPTKMDLLGLPIVNQVGSINSYYVENYKMNKLKLEEELKLTEDGYEGNEGQVWYLHMVDRKTIQFKCKPATIELIHFAAGGLGKNIIKATAYNVFENQDELTIEAVVTLLLEEFTERQIQACEDTIKHVVKEIKHDIEIRQAIVDEYTELGIDINIDKVAVMRWFGQKYPKNDIRKIYSILSNL